MTSTTTKGAVMRLRIRHGEVELEVEGPEAVVKHFVEEYWERLTGKSARVATAPHTSSKAPKSARKRKRGGKQSVEQQEADTSFDPVVVANAIKDHEQYDWLEENVFHKKDQWNKVRTVLWFADDHLTSGEIHRVLHALDDGIDQPSVSKKLKANSGAVIQSGARKKGAVVRYRLKSKARKDYDRFLGANGD